MIRSTPRTRLDLRPYPGDGWEWQVIGKEFPRGPRYQGVVSDGLGTVVYRTRYFVRASDAGETARNRAVHHNVWHTAGAPAGHRVNTFCLDPVNTSAQLASIRKGFRAPDAEHEDIVASTDWDTLRAIRDARIAKEAK